jgi:hypothetical protein
LPEADNTSGKKQVKQIEGSAASQVLHPLQGTQLYVEEFNT